MQHKGIFFRNLSNIILKLGKDGVVWDNNKPTLYAY